MKSKTPLIVYPEQIHRELFPEFSKQAQLQHDRIAGWSTTDRAESILSSLIMFRNMRHVYDPLDVWLERVFTPVSRLVCHTMMQGREADEVLFTTMVSKLRDKHVSYGSRQLFLGGLDGIAIRMIDKCCRIVNLEAQPNIDNIGESIDDTVFDLFGYAILGWCLIQHAEGKLLYGAEV